MPNQESSRHVANTFFPVSSSPLVYGGRERMRPAPADCGRRKRSVRKQSGGSSIIIDRMALQDR